jgi:hypothetical protein
VGSNLFLTVFATGPISASSQHAYRTGRTPTQTEGTNPFVHGTKNFQKFFIFSADLATLKQTLQMVSEQMRQTGIGGLPLLPVPDDGHPPPALPTEDEMIAQATRAVQVSYDQLKRGQDSAAVVANLLTSVERPPVHR